ncbi:MAG: PorV/PorQ family protein [Elusimicrobia bacterium]|nr:PorV/PorQ family protein [Elusimicrobiota bacterium]
MPLPPGERPPEGRVRVLRRTLDPLTPTLSREGERELTFPSPLRGPLTPIPRPASFLLLPLFLIAIGAGRVGAGGKGTSTANFLKLGVGGRAVAMGEAQVALSNDVLSTYWNPAGLGHLRTPEAAFMHNESVQDTRYEYLAYAHPLPSGGTLGGSLSLLTIRDIQGFDVQDRNTGDLRANDLLGTVAWGQRWDTPEAWWQGVSLGTSLKYLRKVLDQDTASTVMADLGAQYELPHTRWQGLTVGLAVQHVGPGLKFVQERSPLPRTLRVGLGYDQLFNKRLSLALDAVKPRDRGLSWQLGGEYRVAGLLAFRLGYRTQDDVSSGLHYGIGVGPDQFHVDYALVPFGELGLTHRVSILARFGAPRATTQRAARAFQRGLQYMEQGLYAEAILEFNHVLEREPTHADALQLMLKANEQLESLLSPVLVSPPAATPPPPTTPPAPTAPTPQAPTQQGPALQ